MSSSLEVQMVTRLSEFERQQIGAFRRQGLSVRETARKLGRDHSVVSRELRRNAGALGYSPRRAQRYTERRSHTTNRHVLAKDFELRAWVIERLADDWSPEQIAGRLKHHPPLELAGKRVSHESIYRYIYAQAPHLYHRLRKAHSSRHPKRGRTPKRTSIPGRTSIWDRPSEATNRTEVGHWESDTVEGRHHRAGLSVQHERVTRFTRIHRLTTKQPAHTLDALKSTFASVPDRLVRSVTFDNGVENTHHQRLGVPTFFCDPYASWQKGAVENTNGLIRQYFPKRTDFTHVTTDQIRTVEHRLNTRPRKCLNYRAPSEMVSDLSGALNS